MLIDTRAENADAVERVAKALYYQKPYRNNEEWGHTSKQIARTCYKEAKAAIAAMPALADYEEVLADHRRLVRELDVALNGEGAAKQASLGDLVAQVSATKREISVDWPDLSEETQAVLTWAHNVMMCCQDLPKDDNAAYPVEVFYLRVLCEKVDALAKARSDRMLNFVHRKSDVIEDGAGK